MPTNVGFASANDEQPMSPTKLRAELERRGLPTRRSNRGVVVRAARVAA
jgi:hypothetical protein